MNRNGSRFKATQTKIGRMVRRIVTRFDPERIVLFGSRARGATRRDSDTDLLIVLPFNGSKREKEVEIRCSLHDIDTPKDIVVVTPEEFERYCGIVGTVIREAASEGKVLYARPG